MVPTGSWGHALAGALTCLLVLGCAPSDDAEPACEARQGGDLRVLALGDSHTRGKGHAPSYRYFLAQVAEDRATELDFLGARVGAGGDQGSSGSAYDVQAHPASWDCQHEGYGGATARDLLQLWPSVLDELELTPDVVLLLAGTNDVLEDTDALAFEADYAALLEALRDGLPQARIVAALPPPLPEGEGNEDIRALVLELCTDADVSVVDVGALEPSMVHPDGIHLSAQGDRALAEAFAEAMFAP